MDISGPNLTMTEASSGFVIKGAGDAALVVELGEAIDPRINQRVQALARQMARELLDGIIGITPTYCSVLVRYDPLRVSHTQMLDWIVNTNARVNWEQVAGARLVRVPVQYGGTDGFDLESVAERCGLSPEEVIARHSAVEYSVYMMGFTPGYPYMGVVDERLRLPRLASPRPKVPAGSVAIAGLQTGIYSIESPGGWHVIGRTPLVLFDPARAEPFLFAPGDRVRFEPL
jgi:KipI family sensor histidine kinase inhibitor